MQQVDIRKVNSNGDPDMTTLFKKSVGDKKSNVTEEDTVKKAIVTRKGRHLKNYTKHSKEKHYDSKSEKEKPSQFRTDIRTYFGKNVHEAAELENGRSSNVFSFVMATRHKQDEAIRELQAKELNDAEELFPNIMKSIPKEQLLANFISKFGEKSPPNIMLMASHHSENTLEENISVNLKTPAHSENISQSLFSDKKKRRSKSVSFSKSVETIEIIKEPDEHTWEVIMDSELNKAKHIAFNNTLSTLINFNVEDLDVNVIFKDEIDECINAGKKRRKCELKSKVFTKPKSRAKNCVRDHSEEEFKENVKVNKIQRNITNFFIKPNKKKNETFEKELQNICKETSTICNYQVNSIEEIPTDISGAIVEKKKLISSDNNDDLTLINDSTNSLISTNVLQPTKNNITQDESKQNVSKIRISTLRLFRLNLDQDNTEYPLNHDKTEYPLNQDKTEHPLSKVETEYPLNQDKTEHPLSNVETEYYLNHNNAKYPLSQDITEHPLNNDKTEYPLNKDETEYHLNQDKTEHPSNKDKTENSLNQVKLQNPLNQDEIENPFNQDKTDYPSNFVKTENPLNYDKIEHPLIQDNNEQPLYPDKNEPPLNQDKIEHPLKHDKIEQLLNHDKIEHPLNQDKIEHPLNKDKTKYLISNDKIDYPLNNHKIKQPLNKTDYSLNNHKIKQPLNKTDYPLNNDEIEYPLHKNSTEYSLNKDKTEYFLKKDKTEEPISLRRSMHIPKKRQIEDIIIDSKNSSCEPDMKKFSLKKESTPKIRHKKKLKSQDLEEDDSFIEIIEMNSTANVSEEKPKKNLASIFMKKAAKSSSPQICSTASKARRDFLFSETPSLLQNKECTDDQIVTWPPFPLYNHVRQMCDDPIWLLPKVQLPILSPLLADQLVFSDSYKLPLQYKNKEKKLKSYNVIDPHPTLQPLSVYNILYHLKAKNPQFPVFSVFTFYLNCKIDFLEMFAKEPNRVVSDSNVEESSALIVQELPLLSKRKRPSRRLSSNKRARIDDSSNSVPAWQKWIPYSWNQVFAPKDVTQVIQNDGVKFELKEWLEQWKHKSDLEDSKDRYENKYRDSNQNSNSCDSDDQLVNTVLLSGQSGVGKTSLVYALGQELGIKVLEINASVRRQGKHIMTQLSEATQSHSVSTGSGISMISPLSSHSPQILKDNTTKKSKCGRFSNVKDASDSVDGSEKKKSMALILFEDIDIVFEDYDDGFMSAVSHFMATTKRPIILTCNQPLAAVRAKIKGNFWEAEMKAPNPVIAANYLQLMCLANGVFLNAKEVEHLISANCGDIRKSILELQFWGLSGSSNTQWINMEKPKLQKTASSDLLLEGDVFPNDIFPKLGSRKSVDVPISKGCMWAKSSLSLTSLMHRDKEHICNMHWSLFDGNLLTLLPFNYKVVEIKKPKYPLESRDPSITNAYEFQKYDWLMLEEEVDQIQSEPEKRQEKCDISSAAKTVCKDIINSMGNLFNAMSDLDVLEGHKCNMSMQSKYLTGLDDTADESFVSVNNADLISNLATGIFMKENAAILNGLKNIDSMEDCLQAVITSDQPDVMFKPHQYWKESNTKIVTEINDKIRSKVPLLCQTNCSGVTMDYLPYIRTIARQDQLGIAMKKYKRSSRYLSHLSMMGYYLSPEECISITNFFP